MTKGIPDYFQESVGDFCVVNFTLQRPFYEPDNGATSWYAEIGLGSPPQGSLRFMVDTGTKNTWITSNLCHTNACAPHRKFNPEASKTFQKDGDPQTISFGTWGEMKVTPSKDLIFLPEISDPQEIQFYISTNYTGEQFQQLICDGGIAIPANMPDTAHSTEILNMLKQKGIVKWSIASFWYDRKRLVGQALFGGIDHTKFNPNTINIMYLIDFPNDKECWLINLQSMNGLFRDGSKEVILNDVAIALDTGSSRFKGDHRFITAAKNSITNNGQYPERICSLHQLKDYPYPDLELVFNGVSYKLTPEQYFIQISETEWELAFHDMADMENEFLVGTVFLEKVYSIFDFENRYIVLAEPVY